MTEHDAHQLKEPLIMTLTTPGSSLHTPPTRQQLQHDPLVSVAGGVGRNLLILAATFALYVSVFVVCTALVSTGAALTVLVLGLVIVAAALAVAGWAADLSRTHLLTPDLARIVVPRAPTARGFSAGRSLLRDPQSWRDLLLVVIMFPASTASFCVAVVWVVGGLGGVTYALWNWWLPQDYVGPADLLGLAGCGMNIGVYAVLGVLLLATVRPVLRGLVRLQSSIVATSTPAPSPRPDTR